MKELLLAYDIGTTGAKAAIFRKDGFLLGSSYTQYDTYYPKPGWIEQAPEDWWQAVVRSTRNLISESKIDPHEIAAISFSGQMMGQVPVDKNGLLLVDRVPIWADARASKQVDQVFEKLGGYEEFYRITMQGHNPML